MITKPMQKLENPFAISLKENIILENKIYELKGDTYNQLLTVLMPSLFDNNLEYQIGGIIDKHKNEFAKICKGEIIDANVLMQAFFILYIMSITNKEIDGSFHKIIEKSLEAGNKIDYYKSNEILGLLSFCLIPYKRIDKINNISSFKDRFEKRWKKAIADKDFISLIDLSIGVEIVKDKIGYSIQDLDVIASSANLSLCSLERLAKLLIAAKRLDRQNIIDKILPLFENKIIERFSSLIFPDIELTIFEAMKLISSSLSLEEIQIIINSLKGRGIAWVDSIKDISNEYITTKLPKAVKIPPLSPSDDIFSLIALSELELERLYYIKEKEYEVYKIGLGIQKGYLPVSTKQLKILLLANTTVLMTIILGLLFSYNSEKINELLMTLSKIDFNITSMGSLLSIFKNMFNVFFETNVTKLFLIILLTFWYLIKFNIYFINSGRVTIKSFWRSIPLIPSLTKSVKDKLNKELEK